MHWRRFLALGAALTLAGCGSATQTVTTTATQSPAPTSAPVSSQTQPQDQAPQATAPAQTTVQYTMPPDPGGSGCSVQLSQHTAIVIWTSRSLQVQPACSSWVHLQSEQGQLWIETSLPAGGPPAEGDSQVCTLTDAEGRATAIVWDSGSAFFGQQACTDLISGGWTEVPFPNSSG